MLFVSETFLFFFLPLTVIGYYSSHFAVQVGAHFLTPHIFLIISSIIFYSFWHLPFTLVLISSILFNYFTIQIYMSLKNAELKHQRFMEVSVVCLTVIFNLCLLGYFKYRNFFIQTVADQFELTPLLLPLAISFYTFQQIAYAIDVHKGVIKNHRFVEYVLFVSFFPQLIAGPIVHHSEMMPQFSIRKIIRLQKVLRNIGVGSVYFVIGMFKKLCIADQLAPHADNIFIAVENGVSLSFIDAWFGVSCFAFQLYFDFSGYSCMAIGLAKMFDITLPINFKSPYKSESIIDFWRCWHVTLSRFLRDYIYIPLGGNRKKSNKSLNIMVTMVLGGFWHGAAWTFVLWGAFHGTLLVLNHLFRAHVNIRIILSPWLSLLLSVFSRILVLLLVIFGWVFFRATSLESSLDLALNMIFLDFSEGNKFTTVTGVATLSVAIFISQFLPNTQEYIGLHSYRSDGESVSQKAYGWRHFKADSILHAIAIFAMLMLSIIVLRSNIPADFLYFNF